MRNLLKIGVLVVLSVISGVVIAEAGYTDLIVNDALIASLNERADGTYWLCVVEEIEDYEYGDCWPAESVIDMFKRELPELIYGDSI